MPVSTHIRLVLAAWVFLASALFSPAATTHIVKRGETLSSIAATYGFTVQELARANRLKDVDQVRRGQKLLIPDKPGSFLEHVVGRGESLASIAKRYKVSIADLRAYNDLKDPNHITRGQKLRVPVKAGAAQPAPKAAAAVAAGDRRRVLPAPIQSTIDAVGVTPGRWKNIVIHHSGTREGSGKGMDRYHREERRMENGLAYHFVIGNGHGMGDGEIYVSRRWTGQLDGGHLAIAALNANSLGICLVGDFSKSRPTARQLDTLEALCRALMRKTRVTRENVTTHRLIHPKHTQCPGRYFPTASFTKRLAQP